MKLKEYKNKRDFLKTSEPKGGKKKTSKKRTGKGNPIFVIQHHKATTDHYDFRLEHKGVLLSWAVPKGLSLDPSEKRLAVMVEDHPLDYADFEGVIPKGNYGAGSVEIFDRGYFKSEYPMDYGLKKGHIKVVLFGEKFKGVWSLVRMDEKNWLIIASKANEEVYVENAETSKNMKTSELDKATQKDKTEEKDNAGKRDKAGKEDKADKRDRAEIREKNKIESKAKSETQGKTKKNAKNPFDKCDFELATLADKIPSGEEWLFEIKYDGYRIMAFKEGSRVRCMTRGGMDYSKKLAGIVKSLKELDENVILDGEVVSFDEGGRSDFGLLQSNLKLGQNLYFVVFDILAINGKDLRCLPLIERKKKLEMVLARVKPNIIYSTHIVGKGKSIFSFAKKKGLEGIVAKKSSSKYLGKRSDEWLKIKCYKRQEFIIVGYTKTSKNPDLSAILLGVYNGKNLSFVGKCGTGFSERLRRELSEELDRYKGDCPLNEKLNLKDKVVWIEPKVLAEISFAEVTKDGLLRQPSFVGIREDKDPKAVHLEVGVGRK